MRRKPIAGLQGPAVAREYSQQADGRNAPSSAAGRGGRARGAPCAPAPGRRPWGRKKGGNCVRCSVPIQNTRRILCVFPHYTPAFGTFNHAYRLMKGVRAFMPPQGLLLIAAYMPQAWPVRFVDENIRKATAAEIAWADVVLVSGMHVQAPQIH